MNYKIDGTKDTPLIEVSKEGDHTNIVISGVSMPENPLKFYEDLLSEMESYLDNPSNKTSVEMNLSYINSGSLKQLFNLLFILEEVHEDMGGVELTWKYKSTDSLMKDKGEDIKEMIEIPVQLAIA
jgi:hypothetical protein